MGQLFAHFQHFHFSTEKYFIQNAIALIFALLDAYANIHYYYYHYLREFPELNVMNLLIHISVMSYELRMCLLKVKISVIYLYYQNYFRI